MEHTHSQIRNLERINQYLVCIVYLDRETVLLYRVLAAGKSWRSAVGSRIQGSQNGRWRTRIQDSGSKMYTVYGSGDGHPPTIHHVFLSYGVNCGGQIVRRSGVSRQNLTAPHTTNQHRTASYRTAPRRTTPRCTRLHRTVISLLVQSHLAIRRVDGFSDSLRFHLDNVHNYSLRLRVEYRSADRPKQHLRPHAHVLTKTNDKRPQQLLSCLFPLYQISYTRYPHP